MRTSPRRFKKYIAEAATGISNPVYQLPNSLTKSFRRRVTIRYRRSAADLRLAAAEKTITRTTKSGGLREGKKESNKMFYESAFLCTATLLLCSAMFLYNTWAIQWVYLVNWFFLIINKIQHAINFARVLFLKNLCSSCKKKTYQSSSIW